MPVIAAFLKTETYRMVFFFMSSKLPQHVYTSHISGYCNYFLSLFKLSKITLVSPALTRACQRFQMCRRHQDYKGAPSHRSPETATTRSCPAVFVFVGALGTSEVAHLRKKESQLLDSVMARNFAPTRKAMHCDGARTRHLLGRTPHAGLSALVLFIGLRLYGLLCT